MSITSVGSQAGGVTQDNANAVTRAFGVNVTAGNRVVVIAAKSIAAHRAFIAGDCTKSAGTATIGAITLDATASYNDTAGPSGVWLDVGIWSAPVTGSGSLTMRVAGDAGTYWVFATDELNSSLGSNQISVGTTSSGSDDGGGPDSGNITPASFDAAIIGGMCTGTTGAEFHTPDAAFTTIYEEEDGSSHATGAVIRRVLTTGSDSASWTLPVTVSWVAAAVAYIESAAAPDPFRGVTSANPIDKRRRDVSQRVDQSALSSGLLTSQPPFFITVGAKRTN